MSMDVSGVNSQYGQYYTGTTGNNNTRAAEKAASEQDKKGATVEISGSGMKAYENSKSDGTVTAKTDKYATAKKSEKDRAAIVKQMQAEQEKRNATMMNMVKKMLGQQTSAATGDNSIWKFLADGNFTVDAKTKLEAQQSISEDGYYGVKQTSQRLFEFAQALAGDDVDKMKEMQAAIEKGYKQATGAWGKDLPSICQETMDAVNGMFDDYYASK